MNKNIKKQNGIIWLNKIGLEIGIEMMPSIFKYNYAGDAVIFLDVVNEDKLIQELTAYITQNKIPPSNLLMVLGADMVFEEQVAQADALKIDEKKQAFMDSVPYENVYIKVWPTPTGPRMVAFNFDLFQSIKDILENLGFTIDIIIPYFLSERNNLDITGVDFLLKKKASLKADNVISEYTTNAVHVPVDQFAKPPPKKNASLLWTIPVFAVLIIILFYMLQGSIQSEPLVMANKRPVPTKKIIKLTPTIDTGESRLAPTLAQIIPTDIVASVSADLNLEIRIGSLPLTKLELFKKELNNINIKNIIVKNDSAQTQQNKTLIIFSQKVDPQTRTKIIDMSKQFFVELSAQEGVDIIQDVILVVGKQIP